MKATRNVLMLIVFLAGISALTWELIWQLKVTLALGISAYGTAITLAATMGGMTAGSLICGALLARTDRVNPFLLYAVLEIVIAFSGLLLAPGFQLVENLDRTAYRATPWIAPGLHLLAILVVLGPPTFAMGATLPTFRRLADSLGATVSISVLYGLNTLGAAFGVMLAAFAVIPALGVIRTIYAISALNLFVALVAILLAGWVQSQSKEDVTPQSPTRQRQRTFSWSPFVAVFTTGFATFALEVAWFRAMRSAFQSTTEGFAIILASVLIPLAIAANVTPRLRRLSLHLGHYLVAAGAGILLSTPLMERIDTFSQIGTESYWILLGCWFGISLLIVSGVIGTLGIVLPWSLEQARNASECGRLYAVNTFGAIVGALLTAWVIYPSLGFSSTCWAIGIGTGAIGAFFLSKPQRIISAAAIVLALMIAYRYESGVGTVRVHGLSIPHRVLVSVVGPEFTVSVIETRSPSRSRELVIDGFRTAGENYSYNYMEWMGRLPMIAHPNPKRALVICFGTGQTANAVRLEGPERLDIVELSESVLGVSSYFRSNDRVLEDPRVRSIVMDGRAWLRRSDATYDVVTLEPMPPFFAGSNALYSKEFYELIASRLNEGGVVAQWMPFHLLAPYHATSVANSFTSVFPNAVLWFYPNPEDATGIIVGTQDPDFQWNWPGLERDSEKRTLSTAEVRDSVLLTPQTISAYTSLGRTITDDNQLLSFGGARRKLFEYGFAAPQANLQVLLRAAAQSKTQGKSPSPKGATP